MRVTIDVNDDRLKQALATLGVSQDNAAAGGKAICELSAKLVLEWLLNEKCFETMSQATEHWVASFEEGLFPDEAPDPTKLYDRCTLPLPKARYLARLLLARRSGRWRVGARKELLARLREKEADARLAEEQKRISQEFDCVFSRPAYEEFQALYEKARATPNPKRPLSPPRVISSFIQEVTVRVRCQVVLVLIELIAQRRE
jgi:hypothetical protein